MKTLKDFKVHPVAAMFPLMSDDSEEMKELRSSLEDYGQLEPITIDGDVLLDGRNRLRACEWCKIEPKFQEWSSLKTDRSQHEWIYSKNAIRRNLTPDQLAAVSVKYDKWVISQDSESAKVASQFKPGSDSRRNPGGKPVVAANSTPPQKRDSKEKAANSTAGKVAKKAGVSEYKARQMIAVEKAEADGRVPSGTLQQIALGTVKVSKVMADLKGGEKPNKPLEERFRKALREFFKKFSEEEIEKVRGMLRKELL